MIPKNPVELLQQLIQIPSVNPDGNCGPAATGEGAMAAYLQEFLTALGAHVELHEVLTGRPNVVARFPSNSSGKPRLLFAPHTDTVGVSGMTIDPFGGTVQEGKIWGRGASDTKGSMAAMLWSIKECAAWIADLPYEIWFAGLMGEETGLLGSKALAARMQFDLVIAGEPTDLDVVHTTKGCVWATVRTSGRASHASTPEKGRNAIFAMADVLRCVRDEIAPSLRSLSHPVLGSPTISAGTIAGGSKINVVPDACECTLDMRTIPSQDVEPVFARLRQIDPTLTIEISQSPPLFTPPDHRVIEAMLQCGAKCVGAPWFCDGSSFAAQGMSAVAVGPGSIEQAHTKDEFLSVDDLEAGVKFFSALLRRLQIS